MHSPNNRCSREIFPRLQPNALNNSLFNLQSANLSSGDDLHVGLLRDALARGAAGYLTKDLNPEALLRALRGTQQGELAMSRRYAARVMRHFVEAARKGRTGRSGALEGLSPRENDVLRMLADGLTDREIASALIISPRTVETHVSNILHKLNVRKRAEAAQRYRDSR